MYRVSVFTLNESSDWCAKPNERLFEEICIIDVKERWICSIKNRDLHEKIALGTFIKSKQEEHQFELHLPQWFMNSTNFREGEVTNILFSCSSTLPRASTLTFKVLGLIPEWLDLRSLLELKLSELGVLRKGQILPLPLMEVYGDTALIASFSGDSPYVFMQGEEVALEIIEDELQQQQQHQQQQIQPQVEQEVFRSHKLMYVAPLLTEDEKSIDFSSLFTLPERDQPIKFLGAGRRLGASLSKEITKN